MIPLIGTGKVQMMGKMRIVKDYPVIPDISPGIQGSAAYKLLRPDQKAQLKYALADVARKYNCRPEECRWAFGKGPRGREPLKIWPPKKPIELGLIGRIKKRIKHGRK